MAGTSSLERALVLLTVIEQTPGGLTNAEISRQMKIPKTTCSYIARRLEREGYLTKDEPSGRYKIGLAVVALAHGALREIGIRTVAEPALYKLTSQTGLSGGIGVLERRHVLLVDRVEGSRFVNRALEAASETTARTGPPAYRGRTQRDVGRELPVHSTALGKVLLAFEPPERVLELIAGTELTRSTAKTVTSKTRLLAELEQVRKQGYAIADGETYPDLRSLAVPILGSEESARAALSVNGSPGERVWLDLPELVKAVQDAARDISRRARILRTDRGGAP
jgi:DNA-binding IclR family transcriptional regulator